MTQAEIYCATYNDLILGTAVSVAYVKVAKLVGVFSRYLESATINYSQLVAVNLGMGKALDGSPYCVNTNSKYVSTVIVNCQAWRNQGILDQKSHPEQVQGILNHIDRLGAGQVVITPWKRGSDELMIRAQKHAKHLYYQAQLEIIKNRTTNLRPDIFPFEGMQHFDELPGSVVWRTPMSVAVFEQKMGKSRQNHLTLIKGEKS
jgi:hypothetical protein